MARTQLVRCILLFLISLSYTSCFHATSRLHQSPQRQRRLYLYSTISEQQLFALREARRFERGDHRQTGDPHYRRRRKIVEHHSFVGIATDVFTISNFELLEC